MAPARSRSSPRPGSPGARFTTTFAIRRTSSGPRWRRRRPTWRRGSSTSSSPPMAEIRDGVSAFLDVCVGGDFQRIVLVDGPRVLGAEAWEDLVERYGRSLLEEWLRRCMSTGDLDQVPVRALARLLIAMLTEASLAIARADDPAAERAALGEVLDRILTGLRPPRG